MVYILLIVCILAVLYKIYDTFKNKQPIFDCYVVAYLPLVIFVLIGSINPAWRGNENLFYFLIYIPLFALFILPFTMTPVIIAHIVYKIKNRRHIKSEHVNRNIDAVPVLLFILGLVLFILPILSILGFLLTTGVCVYRIIRFIMGVAIE